MANDNTTNNVNYDSFFAETIVDSKGISVVNMNEGIDNLFKYFNENAWSFEEIQQYLVTEFEEGYPDLLALNSALGDSRFWWWILMLNRLDDPFEDIKQNWVYAINSPSQISSFIQGSNNTNTSKATSRIGKIVELN